MTLLALDALSFTRQWRPNDMGEILDIHNMPKRLAVSETDQVIFNHESGKGFALINTLEPPFVVKKRFLVAIEAAGDSFIAGFEEPNIYASGDTPEEAVSNLKDYVIDSYEVLDAEPPDMLIPTLKREFEAMKRFVGKRADA